jgi:NAD kinase
MKVGILGNKNKIKSAATMAEMEKFLSSCGYETAIFQGYGEIDGVDVVLVLGGDGAILHSAVTAARKNIKIIGINYGINTTTKVIITLVVAVAPVTALVMGFIIFFKRKYM